MQHLPAGASTHVIKSTDNVWSKELVVASRNTDPGFFDEQSRYFIFLENDSLYLVALAGGKNRDYFQGCLLSVPHCFRKNLDSLPAQKYTRPYYQKSVDRQRAAF